VSDQASTGPFCRAAEATRAPAEAARIVELTNRHGREAVTAFLIEQRLLCATLIDDRDAFTAARQRRASASLSIFRRWSASTSDEAEKPADQAPIGHPGVAAE